MQALNPVHHPPAPATYRVEKARQHGFTAIELMVVIAIVAILAALAAPSFTPLIERWRVRQTAESLTSSLYLARSEAIKRGGGVALDATGGWDQGWKVTHTQNLVTTDLQAVAAPAKTNIAQNNGKTMLFIDRWGMISETNGGASAAMNFPIYPVGKTDTDASAIRLCVTSGGRLTQMKQGASCP